MSVHLIRHGESAANAGKATTDPAEIPLTAAGQEQAEVFARSLSHAPTAIICSPFLRARLTAEPVARRFGIPVAIWPIQEFTYLSPARCAGTTPRERQAWVETYWEKADPDYVDGPGAESFAQLMSRVRDTLEYLRTYRTSSHVLLIGHGQFMQAVRWWNRWSNQAHPLTGEQMQIFRRFDHAHLIGNCQGYSLAPAGDGWTDHGQ
jgi:broad specificity phosphatase PhoE